MRVLETLIGEQSLGDTFISSVEATFVLTPLLIGLFLGVLMKKADSQHNESRQLFRSFEWLYWALSTGAISIFATNEYGLFNYDGDPIATRFVYSFLAVNIVAPATIAAAMNFYQWRKSLV